MDPGDIERAAYIAAHQLNDADYHSDCATPGGRQSAKIDKMARIIANVFEARYRPRLEVIQHKDAVVFDAIHPPRKHTYL